MAQSLCIFAGTNTPLKKAFIQQAKVLGNTIAKNGYGIIYGGTNQGMMKVVADAVDEYKMPVTGITTPLLTKAGLNDTRFKMIEEKDHPTRM